jgi:hypothetical protein
MPTPVGPRHRRHADSVLVSNYCNHRVATLPTKSGIFSNVIFSRLTAQDPFFSLALKLYLIDDGVSRGLERFLAASQGHHNADNALN